MIDILVLREDYKEFIKQSKTAVDKDLWRILKSEYKGQFTVHIIEEKFKSKKEEDTKPKLDTSALDVGIED
jgi:hypothetical protein